MSKIVNEENIVNKIDNLIKQARQKVAYHVNDVILKTYMEIGKIIVRENLIDSKENKNRGKSLRFISKTLSQKYGKGFLLQIFIL